MARCAIRNSSSAGALPFSDVAMLLKDRETIPQAAGQPPSGEVSVTAPDFACEACGAEMQRGQDWCLECGTAAPGRLGARPGWRAAFTVVGLTTMLLLCAVVAGYAALTSDAERSASRPAAGSANPITAQTPGAVAPTTPGAIPVAPGATGPGTAAPPVAPPMAPPAAGANTKPIIPVQPPPPTTNTPVAPTPPPAAATNKPGATGSTGSTAGSTGSTDSTGSTATTTPGSELIALRKDAARTYNQPARAGAEFGPAAYAIDGKPNTVWDVVVPADGQPIGAGLVIDLGRPYALSSLRLATTTPGFTLEIYGAKSAKQLPADVIDKRWIHLTDRKAVLDDGLIRLKGKGDGAKVQLLLLHITDAAEPTDPRVAIGDVALRGTP